MNIFSKFFSGLSHKEELALVLDIGSSSVGGALFYLEKSKVPKIIYSIREPIVLLDAMDVDQFLSLTIKSLSVVADKISRSGFGAPKKIFCVLSSTWYGSQTRTIRMEKNTPFVFTTKLADSLIQKEIALFEEEHVTKYKDAGNKVVPIELKNMKTMLNGYVTSNPLNQKAKELSMTAFISIASEQFLEKIMEVTAKYFHRTDIKFSSFVMSSFTVARDVFVHENDFLLVDIGGEVTDISMVKQGVLSASISYPLGRNFMIRGVAKELNSPLDDAKSMLSLFKDGHAAQAAEEKIKPAIAILQNEWLKKFQESLANISTDISVPSTIFVTVNQEMADFFKEIIKTEQFSQYSLTDSKFKVLFLGLPELHGAVSFGKDVAFDAAIVLESIYINRYLH